MIESSLARQSRQSIDLEAVEALEAAESHWKQSKTLEADPRAP